MLALKIIELNLIEQARGTKPTLLLDDVFSELDGARRKQLTNFLKSYQTIITTTDADVVIKNFSQMTAPLFPCLIRIFNRKVLQIYAFEL